MASVDIQNLNAGLDGLVQEGVIQSWQKRPLGMYHIGLEFSEDLRPNSKETAMWVMGASYATQMGRMHSKAEELVSVDEVEAIERHLNMLRDNNALQGWAKDDDGDYIIQLRNGERSGMRAKGVLMWTVGALCMLLPDEV